MRQENYFHFAFKYTLGNEGGYTNIAQDRGGPTNWGITQDDLHRWRKKPVSPYDVRTMHQAEAEAIYKAWYWDTLSLDDILSCPIATAIFDIGVVRGISRSARYAQRVCAECGWSPEVVVDGQVGPKTISVLNQLDEKEFVRRFSALALNGFRGIVENNPSQKIFLRGWENRAKRLLTLV